MGDSAYNCLGQSFTRKMGAPERQDSMTSKHTQRRQVQAGGLYQLLIILRDSNPLIWRRIQVSGATTLARLHQVLQVVMGWQESHLHQFIKGERHYGMPDIDDELPLLDERRFKLSQLVVEAGDSLIYEYDFGDSWTHHLVLEYAWPSASASVRSAVCLGGARACPPEDCGGMSGYEELLTVLADPTHPEHDHFRAWAGEDFDPEAFSLDAVNAELKRLR